MKLMRQLLATPLSPLPNLDLLRVASVLGIVLYHSSILLEHYTEITDPYYYLKFFYSGVDFLFVLSGFLLFYLYQESFSNSINVTHFIRKRLLKIYPLYLALTLGILPFFFFFPALGVGNEQDPIHILKSLLLLPGVYPVLSVGWMLSYQVYFYLLFSLLFFKRTSGILSFIGIACIINYFFQFPIFLFHYFTLEFFLGIFAAYCFNNFTRIPTNLLLRLGFLLLITSASYDISYTRPLMNKLRVLSYGSSAFFLTWGLVKSETLFSLNIQKLFGFLSKASYAIFLSHYPILAAYFMILFLHQGNSVLKWLLSFPIAILCGCLVHLYLEKELVKFLTDKIKGVPIIYW